MPCRQHTFIAIISLLCALAAAPASAQTNGQVRIQGVPIPEAGSSATVAPGGAILDLREEMRMFVQRISTYARDLKPNFVVIAKNGLDLLVKRDATDETKTAPARAYMRAIDGVMQEGLFFDEARAGRPFGAPPLPDRQAQMLAMADYARRSGLKVLTLDFGSDNKTVDEARKQASERGFISLVADTPSAEIFKLPAYPPRPPNENPNSVISLNMVQNFATVRNSGPYGQQAQFALKMHDTNYDALMVEVFHGREPLSRQAVETLKYKKLGAKRLVFAYMNVGTAASYHYYWRANWREGSPYWINSPLRDDPDRYHVEYWNADWQGVMSGNPNSYLYGIIAQGFDGVVLDGLDVYKFFEGGSEAEIQ
ncbi:MAG: endo alpha-1,4 polygalactosaminidase [Rhodospirillales bacterium]|nr:endo alpha-1,4 polygalactosaminidase [Rhodospirillales bacterium]